jgi:hypothetical protein
MLLIDANVCFEAKMLLGVERESPGKNLDLSCEWFIPLQSSMFAMSVAKVISRKRGQILARMTFANIATLFAELSKVR